MHRSRERAPVRPESAPLPVAFSLAGVAGGRKVSKSHTPCNSLLSFHMVLSAMIPKTQDPRKIPDQESGDLDFVPNHVDLGNQNFSGS